MAQNTIFAQVSIERDYCYKNTKMAPVQSKIGKRGLTTKEKKEILKYMKEHPKLTRPAVAEIFSSRFNKGSVLTV